MTKQEGFCLHCRYREMGNYCRKCGSQLVDISRFGNIKCECDARIYPWDYYCANCGRVITVDNLILCLEKQDEEE